MHDRLNVGDIRKAAEIGWKPLRFVASGCADKESVMVPAGIEQAIGVMSVGAIKPYSADGKDAAMADDTALMKPGCRTSIRMRSARNMAIRSRRR